MDLADPSQDPKLPSNQPSKRNSVAGSGKAEDSKMHSDSESDDGLTPEERMKQEAIDKEYERDLKLMESLFPDEASKSKRLLATLEGH